MQASPAFTTVSARQAFLRPIPPPPHHPPPPLPPSETSKSQKPPREWPQAVRQYVQRSFAESNTIPGIGRQEMEAKLKKIISEAAETNMLAAEDWERLPLPQQMLQAERRNQIPPLATADAQMSALHFDKTNHTSPWSSQKKRKSSDLEPEQPHESIPPWRSANNTISFADRISHADKRLRTQPPNGFSKPFANADVRKRRFEENPDSFRSPPLVSANRSSSPEPLQGPVVGRCLDLEKQYFRLTAAPNPDTVRPLHVLDRTLDFLKKKWRKENNYAYICDQFKSLRQDITVQHIKTDFTVNVYEIHARIALEKGDLGEYNQCQTQLRALYAQNLGGHPTEFKAYRILYFLHTCNRTDMNDVLADLTEAEKHSPAVKHALEARSSLALGNYHRFFRLYLETPNMGAYLMDMFVNRERLAALANMCKAYKPDLKLRFITEELGFESDEHSARFICDHGGQAFLEGQGDDIKLSTSKSLSLFESARKVAFQKVDIKGQI